MSSNSLPPTMNVSPDQVYVVGIMSDPNNPKDRENKIDVLREALMQYSFVTDVLDYEEPTEDNPVRMVKDAKLP